MSNQLQVSGAAKIRSIQGPVVANSGVITALDGDASQYVRGDGTLADFPTSTGGGSSVSYYLNSSVSQGTIGGVAYRQLSKVPISGAGTDITSSANGYIASYITDANDPALLEVPAGNFNCEFYFSVNSDAHNPYVYAELYKYDGTTFTLLGSSQAIPEYLTNGTTLSAYYFAIPVATSVLTVTDRIAIRIYVNVDGRTVTLHTENNHLCQVVTTFSKGLISLNNLTRQNQFFGTGTSGTDFAISSATATHTFNLPVASASNTGKLSSTDWSTFNGKVPYTGANANVDLGLNSLFGYDLYANGNGTNNANLYLKQGTASLLIQNGYSNILATGTKIGFQVATSAIAAYYADLQFSSLTAQRTYTLPDASGTISLLESTQTFSGTNTFSAATKQDSGVLLKNGTMSALAGYTGIGGGSLNNGIDIILNGGAFTQSLLFQTAAGYSYTFPAASGTLALLESTQTFSGTNTFSGLTSFTFSSGTRMDYGPYLTKGSVPSAFSGSTTNIYSDATTNNIVIRDTSSIAKLEFNNSTQTFTFPAATGTIALTSNLSSYLPLAGGIMTGSILLNNNLTISGQLFGTSSYASMLAMSPSDKVLIDNSGRGVIFGGTIGQGAYTYTFPSASGTLALTSDLGSYVTLATTQTITAQKSFSNLLIADKGVILATGSTTFLAGSTTLNGNANGLTIGLGVTISGTTTNYAHQLLFPQLTPQTYTYPAATGTLPLGTGTTNYHAKWTGTNTLGNSLIWDNGTNVGIGNTNTSYTLDVTGTGRFTSTLLVSGAATFSGFVGINGSPATAFPLEAYINSSTAYSSTSRGNVMRVYNSNTGANIFAGIELGGAGTANDGLAGLNAVVTGSGSAALTFYTRDGGTFAEKVRITSAGNVGIGTNNPSYPLHISAFDGSFALTGTRGTGTTHLWYTSGPNNQNLIFNNPSGDSYFYSNSTPVLSITTNRFVGIGLNGPSQLLHIQKDQASTTTLLIQNTSDASGAAAELRFYGNVGTGSIKNGQQISFVRGSSGVDWALGQPANSDDFVIAGGTDQGDGKPSLTTAERMRITSGGTSTVLLGKTTSLYATTSRASLEINGVDTSILALTRTNDATATAYIYYAADNNIYFQNNKAGGAIYIQSGNAGGVQLTAGSTAFAPQSDERLKNIQGNIENAIDKLSTLRTVIYSWKSDDENKENLGLIAQDVEKVFPQVIEKSIIKEDPINGISDDTTQYLSLKYTDLIPVLVKAIQEMNTKLDAQNQTIQNLQEQINILAK